MSAPFPHAPGYTIWESGVDDGRFRAWVERMGERGGVMRVAVTETGEILLEEQVHLAYGAAFGPDVDDTRLWQHTVMEAVDAWYEDHGLTPPPGPVPETVHDSQGRI